MPEDLLPHWIEHWSPYYVAACGIATILVSVIPTPQEIAEVWPKAMPAYRLIYNLVQRLSLVRQRWVRNGNAK